MILVLLGTFVADFSRPLKAIEKLCEKGVITEEVVVQSGYTVVPNSRYIDCRPFISPDELTVLHTKARLIITHAGAASLMNAIKLQKKIIAIARLSNYNEHVDDHQVEVLEEFAKLNYILPWRENEPLESVLARVNEFSPHGFISDKAKIISYLKNYIDSL